MSRDSLRSVLLFALACWIWGSTWLAIELGLEGVPPFIGVAIRMAISGIVLVIVAIALRTPRPRGGLYVLHVLMQGVLLFGFQFALVYWAEQTVPSGLVAVLFAANPLWTALMAALVFRIETFTPVNVLGLVMGFCGVILIFWSEVAGTSHVPALGALAVLFAPLLTAISTVFAKRFAHDIPPLATVGPGQLVGAAVNGVLAWLTERGEIVHFTPVSAAALAYLTIFGSAIAFLAFFTLVRTMSITKLSLLTYITPVIAVLLGFFVVHEHLAPSTIAGIPVVFAGIALVHLKGRAHATAPSTAPVAAQQGEGK